MSDFNKSQLDEPLLSVYTAPALNKGQLVTTEEDIKEQEEVTQQDMAAGYFMALEKTRIWVEHFLKEHKDRSAEECLQQLLKLINASSRSIDPLLPKFLQKETQCSIGRASRKGKKDCDEN